MGRARVLTVEATLDYFHFHAVLGPHYQGRQNLSATPFSRFALVALKINQLRSKDSEKGFKDHYTAWLWGVYHYEKTWSRRRVESSLKWLIVQLLRTPKQLTESALLLQPYNLQLHTLQTDTPTHLLLTLYMSPLGPDYKKLYIKTTTYLLL